MLGSTGPFLQLAKSNTPMQQVRNKVVLFIVVFVFLVETRHGASLSVLQVYLVLVRLPPRVPSILTVPE